MTKQLLGSLELNRIYQQDCIEGMRAIPDGSVDMILCDPPYGNMKGAQLNGWSSSTTHWDVILDTTQLFTEYERILRENGVLLLFSQEPYTSTLRTYKQNNLQFSYSKYWRKDHFANALIAKKAPVSYVEDISVFHKTYDTNNVNPLRNYFKQLHDWMGISRAEIIKKIGQCADHTFRYESTQFKLCTESTYLKLIDQLSIDQFHSFIPYTELLRISDKYSRTFNLEGRTFKGNILDFKKDYDGHHPTQKPVDLFRYLIRTYTNPGEIVLDNCMGSGTTAVAATLEERRWIGFELEREYVEIANKRLDSLEIPQN